MISNTSNILAMAYKWISLLYFNSLSDFMRSVNSSSGWLSAIYE